MKKQRLNKDVKISAPAARRRRSRPRKKQDSTAIYLAIAVGVTVVILLLLALSGEPQRPAPRKKRATAANTSNNSQDKPGKPKADATAVPRQQGNDSKSTTAPDAAPASPPPATTSSGLALYRNLPKRPPAVAANKQSVPISTPDLPPEPTATVDKSIAADLQKTEQGGIAASYHKQLQAARNAVEVQGFLKLADWCRDHFPEKTKEVYREILQIWPNNNTARKALGFFRIGTNWFKDAETAKRHGYHQYQGRWYTAKQLKRRGLIYHDGEWLTKAAAIEKGLLANKEHNSRSKTNKRKPAPLSQAKSKTRSKMVKIKKIICHRAIKITTPAAYWQDTTATVFPRTITDLPKI